MDGKITDIEKFYSAYYEAILRANADEVSGFYAEDAVMHARQGFGSKGEKFVGRAAIREQFRTWFTEYRIVHQTTPTGDFTIDHDTAQRHGTFNVSIELVRLGNRIMASAPVTYTEHYRNGADTGWLLTDDQSEVGEVTFSHPRMTMAAGVVARFESDPDYRKRVQEDASGMLVLAMGPLNELERGALEQLGSTKDMTDAQLMTVLSEAELDAGW